ncbi:hypothetical protein SERLA73DRAFT_44838 [Serpula lacrymans var. lacrymans S7.3]|uniref:MULE transposase domain-containing protein n=1 Tax=Serpula lacrymans var. lacrymans (strain S7.3) TaxID=936435 RepID=F8PHD3_SERL3|nr:hypothetical protein SERLA73DRAFT_44838 [Serpula lacrymans var. lacrymans S7.3]
MLTFACEGRLYITISRHSMIAEISVTHREDHIPYCCIDIPKEVHELIQLAHRYANYVRRHILSQLWNKILEKYPNLMFTGKDIYQIWSKIGSQQWKRDEDEMVSAKMLLEEGCKQGGLGVYSVLPIELIPEPSLEALAFVLPDALKQWGGRIQELSLDSTWNTNGTQFELYAALGKVYGSGLPLGYILIQSNGSKLGGKEKLLCQFLKCLKNNWDLQILITLSDKDWTEINALRAEFPEAKHQLCFWHALRAIKQRLAILRCMPAFYDANIAHLKFHWIDQNFVPLAQ